MNLRSQIIPNGSRRKKAIGTEKKRERKRKRREKIFQLGPADRPVGATPALPGHNNKHSLQIPVSCRDQPSHILQPHAHERAGPTPTLRKKGAHGDKVVAGGAEEPKDKLMGFCWGARRYRL